MIKLTFAEGFQGAFIVIEDGRTFVPELFFTFPRKLIALVVSVVSMCLFVPLHRAVLGRFILTGLPSARLHRGVLDPTRLASKHVVLPPRLQLPEALCGFNKVVLLMRGPVILVILRPVVVIALWQILLVAIIITILSSKPSLLSSEPIFAKVFAAVLRSIIIYEKLFRIDLICLFVDSCGGPETVAVPLGVLCILPCTLGLSALNRTVKGHFFQGVALTSLSALKTAICDKEFFIVAVWVRPTSIVSLL